MSEGTAFDCDGDVSLFGAAVVDSRLRIDCGSVGVVIAADDVGAFPEGGDVKVFTEGNGIEARGKEIGCSVSVEDKVFKGCITGEAIIAVVFPTNGTIVVDAVIAARNGDSSGVNRLRENFQRAGFVTDEGAAGCEVIASDDDDRSAVRRKLFNSVCKVTHGAR